MKRFELTVFFLLLSLVTHAEHLFEVGVRAGMAGYHAQCYYVSPVQGLHGGMQISYAYHSSRIVGFRIAATLDRSNAGFGKDEYIDSYSVIDAENEPLQVDYYIGHLQETYTTWSVGIPVQLALSGKNVSFYLGPKIVFPFYNHWTEKADNASLSVYFPLQDNRVYNSFPLAASPSFRELQEGTIHKLPAIEYGLAAEFCYDIPVHTGLHSKSYLSVGVYFDYSFSAGQEEASERISLLMLSDTRDGFPLHRIMTPVVSAQRQGRRLVSSIKAYDLGIKLSYRIAPYDPRRQNANSCRCYGIEHF